MRVQPLAAAAACCRVELHAAAFYCVLQRSAKSCCVPQLRIPLRPPATMPASNTLANTSVSWMEGPMVAMILVPACAQGQQRMADASSKINCMQAVGLP